MNNTDEIRHLIVTANTGTILPEGQRVFLHDVLDLASLQQHVAEKTVTQRHSKDEKLSIYKYGKFVHIRNLWDEITLQTRGVIVDNNNGEIIARGFNKFFNPQQLKRYGIELDHSEMATVMPKEDGSLGIAYYHDGQWRISTPGSMQSEIAVHATKVFNDLYGHVEPIIGRTFLFEIIQPQNRIITDYGNKDDLIFLGATDHQGNWISPTEYEHLPFARNMVSPQRMTVGEALSVQDPRDGTEGYVIRTDSGLLIKYKHPSYLALHSTKYNLTPYTIWGNMKTYDHWEDYVQRLPDEFQEAVSHQCKKLQQSFDEVMSEIDSHIAQIPPGTRKDRALWVQNNTPKHLKKFAMNKGVAQSDITHLVWEAVKPDVNEVSPTFFPPS